MAQMGRAANMQVILCEVPPLEGYTDLAPQIVAFNAALVNFAATNNYLVVDYYTPLLGQPQDFIDGIHPNAAGYTPMEAAPSAVLVQYAIGDPEANSAPGLRCGQSARRPMRSQSGAHGGLRNSKIFNVWVATWWEIFCDSIC